MVGRDVHLARDDSRPAFGDVLLSVKNLAAESFVRDVSFDVRKGEIVCLSGLVGSGRSETCEVIFGARARRTGNILIDGKSVDFRGPWDAMDSGIGMVPEDRKEVGLFLGTDIAQNIAVTVMKRLSPNGVFDEQAATRLADEFIAKLRIATPSARRVVGDLSGGNQQKVLIAKWLAMNPRILIVDEPTRGVDVGARSEIYRILRDLSSKGLALLVVSSDLPEVLALADRIVVLADGRSVGELQGDSATEEHVLRLATRFTQTTNTPMVGEAA
jgi:ABC-type sugar transport system ATPase subunit